MRSGYVRRTGKLVAIAAALGALLLPGPGAMAQNSLVIRSVGNQYIAINYGQSGTYDAGNNVTWPVEGRFGIRTTGGDPTNQADDNMSILDQWGGHAPRYSRVTIRVEDETGETNYILGEANSGAWYKEPEVDSAKRTISGIWVTKDGGIEVKMTLAVLRDTARMEFVARNTGTTTKKVGMRFLMSADVSPTRPLGQVPFFVSGSGRVEKETEWTGANVPDTWRTFETPENPWFAILGILRGYDAVPPDRFAIGWMSAMDTPWDFTPNPEHSLVGSTDHDPAEALWWNVQPLAPGGTATRKIVTYIGQGNASEDLSYPYVLALQAPYVINYLQDTETNTGRLDPNPVEVTAWVTNNSAADLSNVNVWLNLPPGLSLVAGQSAARQIPSIVRGEESSPVTWLVDTSNAPSGVLKLTVGCSANPVGISKVVDRDLTVYASNVHGYNQGWQMFSVPFSFKNAAPKDALGLPTGSFDMWEWDSTLKQYNPVTTLTAGKGYWLRSATDILGALPLANQNAFPVLPGSGQKLIQLAAGWNQIADPFITPLAWRSAKVLQDWTDPNQPLSMQEALDRGWLRRTLFWWDPNTSPSTGQYAWSSDIATMRLLPWVSYWVKANSPCWLVIEPPVLGDWYGLGAP